MFGPFKTKMLVNIGSKNDAKDYFHNKYFTFNQVLRKKNKVFKSPSLPNRLSKLKDGLTDLHKTIKSLIFTETSH